MGQSTDAILVFGVTLGDFEDMHYEELPWAEGEDEEFEDTLARRANARQYPEDGWLDDRKRAAEECPLTLVQHCSDDAPMWILGVKATYLRANRGNPIEFDHLEKPKGEDIIALIQWLDEFEINVVPKWILCSDWN